MKTPFPRYVPVGVIPTCLLPFHDDLTLDERGFGEHVNDVANVRGVSQALVYLGKIRSAAVRPSLPRLTAAEVGRIHTAVRLAGLTQSKVAA